MRKFDIKFRGYRYWATISGRRMTFWSSHKWPFYHGHYTPGVIEREDCWQHFTAWIPAYNQQNPDAD